MANSSLIREQLYAYRYYVGAVTATIFICDQMYRRLFKVPNHLQHIPHLSYWKYLMSLIMKEPLVPRTQRLIFPLLSQANGLYLVCHFFCIYFCTKYLTIRCTTLHIHINLHILSLYIYHFVVIIVG